MRDVPIFEAAPTLLVAIPKIIRMIVARMVMMMMMMVVKMPAISIGAPAPAVAKVMIPPVIKKIIRMVVPALSLSLSSSSSPPAIVRPPPMMLVLVPTVLLTRHRSQTWQSSSS